jgi:molybdopterin molybdotransferase
VLLARPQCAGACHDSNGPMLCAAVGRDGGVIKEFTRVERHPAATRDALRKPDADCVLLIGGTGRGGDDYSAAVLSEIGKSAVHGIAVRPGETAGFGRIHGSVPVFLLPGPPAACLWSYELFAGRAIRRLAGRDAALPYRSREMMVGRKIVSVIGLTEICPIRRRADDTVEPRPSFAEAGLAAAVDADGFVIVPEQSEGHPQGALVIVYLYEGD